MRIIAGKFRSQSLLAPKNRDIRPTSDRLRETLFNVLAPQMEGAVFADLFAGTGAVGIEALSRGARQVYFAENSKNALQTLRSNVERFQISPQVGIEPGGTLPLLRRLARQGVALDLVFMDPPYSNVMDYEVTLDFLGTSPILATGAIIVAEHSKRMLPFQERKHLKLYRSLEQGGASLSFFRQEI